MLLKPFDGADVQMVGRFVEQQQFGRNGQSLGQGQTLLLPAREGANARIGIERKTLDHPLRLHFERPRVERLKLALQLVHSLK